LRWIRNFYLHPIFNRFNLLFFGIWAAVCWSTEGHIPFFVGLGIEAIYLIARSWLDSSGRSPYWRIRKMGWIRKNRFLTLWEKAYSVKKELAAISGAEGMLGASRDQIDKLMTLFLELLIVDEKLDFYLRSGKQNYDAQIAELTKKISTAQGEMAGILEKNLELIRQRRQKFHESAQRRELLIAKLSTIENTIHLLKDSAIGMGVQPAELTASVETLVQNVQDAEAFVSELQRLEPMIRAGG